MKRLLLVLVTLLLWVSALKAEVKRIPVYFFSDSHCPTCRKVKEVLSVLKRDYPLVIVEYKAEESLSKLRPLRELQGYVPREIPVVLVGEEILEGGHPESVYREALSRWRTDTFGALLEENNRGPGELSAWLVITAGLLDGINPCAFSVFVFLILYMAAAPKRKKVMMRTVAGFAAGVFSVYLALGLGLREVARQAARYHWIKSWLYAVAGLILFVLALFSFIDFLRMRKNRLPLIRIPDKLKKRITRLEEKAGLYWTGAFLTGGLVAWLELGCTGQIYFPVILSIAGRSPAEGLGLLFLYNIMFILPLLAVGGAVLSGFSVRRFRGAYTRFLPLAKLFMALFFILLGITFFSLA